MVALPCAGSLVLVVLAEPALSYPSLATFLFLCDAFAFVLLAPSQVLIAVVAFSYLVATVLALLPIPATPVSRSNGSLFLTFPAQLPSTFAFSLLSPLLLLFGGPSPGAAF